MEIRLNGEMRSIAEGSSVAELVESLGLASRRVAVELNQDIVSRTSYAATVLRPGDVVEVVQFVGGG
jgi:sulfur carrier protein